MSAQAPGLSPTAGPAPSAQEVGILCFAKDLSQTGQVISQRIAQAAQQPVSFGAPAGADDGAPAGADLSASTLYGASVVVPLGVLIIAMDPLSSTRVTASPGVILVVFPP
mmetsp:Transcript_26790/g.46470  ORF Transcript_26790/g.46470 Transcript_26790/m.46470 type:complete len:110 (-) Transcript_26790:109-438(-)